ncbi:Gfo/Idh/MocA family protein [Rariglobus hedericola]|uniref:Gfo/Idh/MocA family oxidoreductase n=1 Tax=Rariglobus hedericola TaxID=2597822 RepID=A0A556QL07_9BACT|nr:Gfo/Idh/MocA family oxidoreductase [Rariglobus hedericola]TSJ77324.1 Gfo/Idh/MocA family oxidoreductase [Rariglobus hedericola]
METPKLKIGVIGSGGRGGILAAIAHRSRQGARVVAVCDINPATLARNRADFGPDIFTTADYRHLLERNLDAVIIATPDFLHEEQAVAALKRGLAVYLEKPMALTIAGCDRILAAAARSKAHLYLGHNMRHMPFVRKMKEIIDSGAIGEVKACWVRHFVGHGGDFYFHDWHAERRYSNGLLLQKAAHDIDVIHWLCGGYTRRVSGMGALTLYGDIQDRLPASKRPRPVTHNQNLDVWPPSQSRGLNHRIDVEDLSSMQMLLDNGVQATYSQCHYTPDYWRSYTVIGTEGRLENFGNGEPGTVIRVWNQRRPGYDAVGSRTHRVPKAAGGHGGADPRIIAEFIRFARDGGETATSPLAARESVAAGCRATESLRSGGGALSVPRIPARLTSAFLPFQK